MHVIAGKPCKPKNMLVLFIIRLEMLAVISLCVVFHACVHVFAGVLASMRVGVHMCT